MSSDLPLHLQIAILSPKGRAIGSGLILDERFVLTCTHVVSQATAGDKAAAPAKGAKIKCRLIPWEASGEISATLLDASSPIANVGDRGLRDLALLRLENPIDGFRPGPGIYPGAHAPSDPTTLFAFTESQPDGIRSDIVIKGVVADGWHQADSTPAAQYKIQPGFSGTPVFVADDARVLGLVAASDSGEARVGFLIPGSVLLTFLERTQEGPAFANRFRAPGPVINAPDLPQHKVPRAAIIGDVKNVLLGPEGSIGLVGLRGMPGIGKTVAARLLLEDSKVRKHFYDGIYWITVGEGKTVQDLESEQRNLASKLGAVRVEKQSMHELRETLAKQLSGRRVLLIIDDIWTEEAVRAFDIRQKGCAILFTSRKRSGFDANNVPVKDVELLGQDEAESLFRAHAKIDDNQAISRDARKIMSHCNRHALAIVVAASMLGNYPDEEALILERFDNADVREIVASVPDYRRSGAYPDQETTIFRFLDTSYSFLAERERTLLSHFGIFPEDTRIPLTAVELLGDATGLDSLKIKQSLDKLSDVALLTFHRAAADSGASYVTFHDIQRDFAVSLRKDWHASHASFIKALRKRNKDSLYALDPVQNDEYLRRFAVRHLAGAGMLDELFALLIDPDWIGHRLASKDPVWEIIADYDLGLAQPDPLP
jgi:hypothetical protein